MTDTSKEAVERQSVEAALRWKVDKDACANGNSHSDYLEWQAADEIKRLKADITAANEKLASMGWRTDFENAPKDGTELLCSGTLGSIPARFVVMWNGIEWYSGWGVPCVPTHFMLITSPDATHPTTPASHEGQS